MACSKLGLQLTDTTSKVFFVLINTAAMMTSTVTHLDEAALSCVFFIELGI